MTLKEQLDKLKDDDYVYFGTKKGSSWLYICKKETLEKNLDKINDFYRNQSMDKLEKEGKKINDLPKEIEKQEKCIDKLLQELRNAYEALDSLTDRYVSAWKHRDHYKEYLEKWVDVDNREVKESYSMIEEPNSTAIVIEGEETGNFWTLKEVEKYNKKRKKE